MSLSKPDRLFEAKSEMEGKLNSYAIWSSNSFSTASSNITDGKYLPDVSLVLMVFIPV